MGCGSSTAVGEVQSPTKVEPELEEPPAPPLSRSASGPEPFTDGGSVPTTVRQWLTEIRMQEYVESFQAAGLTTLVKVTQMTQEHLETAGVVKVGHKKKLMKHKELVATHMRRQNSSSTAEALRSESSKVSPVAISALEVAPDDAGRMAPRVLLRSDDPVPEQLANLPLTNGARVRVFKSVHAANDPCEDRHTVVHGNDFLFAGVWDGHTGHHCSQFAEDQVFLNLRRQVEQRTPEEIGKEEGLREPFERAYHDTDKAFLQEAKRKVRQRKAKGSYLFAGTCAVGAYCDLGTRKISVSNLGDSRAVIGLYEPTGLRTVVMSHDQTANDSAEIRRLKADFPTDETILINKGTGDKAEDSDWRVKGICQFTRSIGDFQMKERSIATVYNDYTRGFKVVPAPKTQRRADGTRAPPYVIPTPEFREQHVEDGFLLLACDGLWDEMQNEEAVSVVAGFLRNAKNLDESDIAAKLIDYALQKAALRVAAEIPEVAQQVFADVNSPTADELRALPPGKKTDAHRSCLHDDISVVIIVFGSEKAMRGRRTSTNLYDDDTPTRTRMPRQGRRASIQGRKGDNSMLAVDSTEWDSSEREEINRHILAVFDTCAAMNASQLRFIFDALDVDPKNGFLSRAEAEKLCENILGEAGTPAVVEALYQAMDHDHTDAITFENFLQFFSVSQDDDHDSGHTALAGFQKLYNLLAEIPLMAHLTQDEQQDLAHALTKVSYTDGEVIINQGEEIDSTSCMYIIDDGAAVCKIDGKTVSRYEKGRYFGELALQQNQPRAASIVADGQTTCSTLKAWEFDWLITQKKSLKSLLLERSGRRERESFETLPDATADILEVLEGDGTADGDGDRDGDGEVPGDEGS